MPKKFHNINFLGHIPFNPDLLLEKGRFRDRPVGIFPTDLIKMYWTVRSFQVSIAIQVIAQKDPLTTFIRGGGTSGGIVGATAGLAAVNQNFAQGDSSVTLKGHTKILRRTEKYIRNIATTSIPFEGVRNGKLDIISDNLEELQRDPNAKKNPLVNVDLKPNEASLCVPGPWHRLSKGGAYLSIDFSDIFYYQKKYWPKIIFTATRGETSFTSNPLSRLSGGLTVLGGIQLMSYNIPIYGSIDFSPDRIIPPIAFVNGSIKPGNRCCDRFFYDGFDNERFEKCKDECGDGVNGVYNKEKTK